MRDGDMSSTRYETTRIEIRGYLVGAGWWPGRERWKACRYTAADRPFADGALAETLRDHVLRITNDHDFQSCDIAQGIVIVTRRSRTTGALRARAVDLERFPSVADMVRRDWFPSFDEDEGEDD